MDLHYNLADYSHMENKKELLGTLIVVFVIVCLFYAYTRFTPWPEMLLWPYLINKGWLPYKDIAIVHSPLLPVLVAGWYRLWGTGLLQLKIFSWALTGVSTYLTYSLARKITNQRNSLFSAGLFLIFNSVYEGNSLWFESLLVPVYLCIWLKITEKKWLQVGYGGVLHFLRNRPPSGYFPSLGCV